jgi:CheY-like chemotaxis protein
VGSKVIFVTGSREPSTMARIEQDHPAGVLFKPIYGRQLQNAVNKALAA